MIFFMLHLSMAFSFQNWQQGVTNPSGKPAVWHFENRSAYKIVELGDTNNGRFNISWASKIILKDTHISVLIKPESGKIDQGGGVIWRVLDQNNYYIARYNPLEGNARVYFVKEGKRKILGSQRVRLSPTQWHELSIFHKDNQIQFFINSEKIIDVIDDTFRNPGMVGVWTKADAITLFRNFEASKI